MTITPELIERINFLARKSRTEGLTPEEKEEQQKARRQYLDGIRGQVIQTLENVKFVDEEGNECPPPKKDSALKSPTGGCGCCH